MRETLTRDLISRGAKYVLVEDTHERITQPARQYFSRKRVEIAVREGHAPDAMGHMVVVKEGRDGFLPSVYTLLVEFKIRLKYGGISQLSKYAKLLRPNYAFLVYLAQPDTRVEDLVRSDPSILRYGNNHLHLGHLDPKYRCISSWWPQLRF